MKEYIERDAAIRTAIQAVVAYSLQITGHGITQFDAVDVANRMEMIPTADIVEREALSGIMRESMVDAIKEFASNFDRRLCLRQRWYAEKGENEKAQAFEEVHELLMQAVEEV